MKTKFRKFLAYLLVLMLICSDLAVPVFAEEVAVPGVGTTEPAEPAPGSTLTLPASLKIIEEEAFCGNISIARVIVPEGTTEIRSRAFANSSLTEIVLPSTLSSIANDAFDGCSLFTVSAEEGTYAYQWASEMGYIGQPAATPDEYFETELLEDDTLMITGYTGTDVNVVIPEAIGGVTVTRISDSAFESKDLISVVIPDAVTVIGAYAFGWNWGLRSAPLPASLVELGPLAFNQCDLREISLPEGLRSIGESAFGGNERLTSIHIPASVTYMGEGVFYDGHSLETITIAEGNTALKMVDGVLFDADGTRLLHVLGKDSLTEYTVPDGVVRIGANAFEGADQLASITLPESLRSIGGCGFRSCRSLTEIDLPAGCTRLDGNVFESCTSLKEIVLPEGLILIDWATFSGCENLESVVLPSSLNSIEDRAFADCPSLATLRLPGSIRYIGEIAFDGTTDTVVIVAPGSYAESWCIDNSFPYEVDETIESDSIFDYEHYDEDLLIITGYNGPGGTVTVPASIHGRQVVAIDEYVFAEQSIEKVILPEGLTHIYSESFQGCVELAEINLPSTLQYIGYGAFMGCDSLTEIVLPEGLTRLGGDAFWSCNNLKSVSVPGSLESIEECTFGRCTSLTSVTLNEGITSISFEVFDSCSSLTEIVLPDSLVDIGSQAFNNCTSLTSITIPANVTETGYSLFSGCYSLTEIHVAEGNEALCFEDGFLYSKDRSILLTCLPSKTGSVTIPEQVTTLGMDAFSSCSGLTSITIPATVLNCEYPLFDGCSAVIYVAPNSAAAEWCLTYGVPFTYLTSGEGDFTYTILEDGTAALTGYTGAGGMVVVPSQLGGVSVTAIAENAFNGNAVITGVILPEGVISIGAGAFSNCVNPITLSLPMSVSSIGADVITGGGGVAVTVPAGSYAEQWCIDSGLEYTQAGAENLSYTLDDSGNATITGYSGSDVRFTIPAQLYGAPVVAIGSEAFAYRNHLRFVTIPASVTSIAYDAFRACWELESFNVASDNPAYTAADGVIYSKDMTALKLVPENIYGTFTVPGSVTSIDAYAFQGRSDMTQIILPDGLLTIGDYAFAECYGLTGIELPATLQTLGDSAFAWCDLLKEIVLPDSLTSLGENAFCECYNLRKVTFGSGLTEIPQDAFGCTDLAEVVIPEGVTTIGRAAFADNGNLKSVTLPSTLTTLGQNAFAYSSLTAIDLPAALVSLGEEVFYACTELTEINVDAANPAYCSVDGVLYSKDHSRLITFPGGKSGSFEVPAGVTTIEESAFYFCGRLQSVVVPEGITALGEYTFAKCAALSSVTLPASIVSISDTAFMGSPAVIITAPEGSYAYSWAEQNGFLPEPCVLESDHPYGDNVNKTWSYTHDTDAYALALTFSAKTELEGGFDYLYISDSERIREFTGTSLSGATIMVRGNSFTIRLTSDDSYSEFGFRIISVETATQEEYDTLTAYETRILDDGTLEITNYNGNEANVVIPSEISGKTVSAIGPYAFARKALTSVVIPDSVTTIGEAAFEYCSSLSEVTLPSGLQTINGNAFCNTSSLTAITLPATLKQIGYQAFASSGLTEIVIPEGVTTIYDNAFSNCASLSRVTLPASLISIGSNTFSNSPYVIILAPEGSYAYQWAIENGYLSENAILECAHPYANSANETWEYTHPTDAYALAVTFSSMTQFEQGFDYLTLTDANGKSTRFTGSALTGATIAVKGTSFTLNLTSDSSVQRFGFRITDIQALTEEDYSNFNFFTTSVLSDGTLSITGYVGDATDLVIPAEIDGVAVTRIGANAFINSLITSVVISEGVTSIDANAFNGCYRLTSLVIPDSVTTIGSHAFANCTALTSVEVGDGVTEINQYAFAWCHALTDIALPGSVTSIHEYAFLDSSKVTITAPEGSYAYNWAYENNYLDVAVIESDHPYEGQTTLTWDYTAQNEGTYALLVTFSRKTALVGEDVLYLTDGGGNVTGYSYSNLAGQTIPLIGRSFTVRLDSIYGGGYGFAITRIEELDEDAYLNYGDFTCYTQQDGTLAISGYTGLLTNLTIPSEIDGAAVTAIGESAFNGNKILKSVVIPGGVTSIGYAAFANCSSLTAVALPESLTTLETHAFSNNPSLTEITVPGSITSIGTHVFSGCTSLTRAVLSEGLTTIGAYMFQNCSSLAEVVIPSSVTAIYERAFASAYRLTSVTLPEGLTTLDRYAFAWCSDLTEITIPGSVASIGVNTFYECSDITEVTIGEGTTAIESWAFGNNYSLESVHLPASMTSIHEYAFANNNKFTIYAPEGSYAYQWAEENDLLPETAIIESAHPYAPGSLETWTHTSDSADTYAHLVTFSRKTYFGNGDWLEVIDGNGTGRSYSYADLQNRTLCLPGNSFTLTLHTNEDEGEYNVGFGFMVTAIEPMTEEEFLNYGEFTYYQQSDGTIAVTGFTGFRPELVIPAEIDGMQVATIDSNAFNNNDHLESVVIPEGVTMIYGHAFYHCDNLSSIILPASLTYINEYAFDSSHNATIYAPAGSYAYQWAEENDLLPETAIIESAHPYAPGSNETWTHTSDSADTYAHLVTFSRRTYFGNGDWLEVTDGSGNGRGYSYADLQNKTLCLPGSSFTLTLHSNEDEGDYNVGFGFMVTSIVAMTEEEFLNYGEFTYNTLDDGTVAITGFTGFRPELVIPAEIDGAAVTRIESSAFSDNDHLESIVIPEGVTAIGSYAFESCNGLTEVVIPSTLTEIGYGAFGNCTVLTEITIPEGVTMLEDWTFGNCYNLYVVHLPASLTYINEGTFGGINNYSIDAPEGSYACSWAADHGKLAEPVVIESEHPYAPNTDQTWEYVHETDAYAMALRFSRMTYFANGDCLTLTDSEGNETQYYYSDLTSKVVILPGNSFTLRLASDGSEENFGFILTEITAFESEEELREYGEFTYRTLEDGTLEITGFTGVPSSLTIPAEIDGTAVTAISSYAFEYADHLESVVLPEGLLEIGIYAFDNCVNLTEIILPSTLTTIRNNAFSSCTQLTEITIPEGVTSLEHFVLGNCYKLETAYLPASLTYINDSAFANIYNYYISAPEGSYAYNWARAENKLPEGLVLQCEHPYAPNTDQTWEYMHDGEAQLLAVSFSRMCFFSDGDHLILTDSEGNETYYYYGDLASRTITVPGNSFSLRLVTNDSAESYGFRVTQVLAFESEEEMQNYGEFTYNTLDDGTLEVTGFTGFRTDLTIPSEINSAAVTRIASQFAAHRTSLTSIVIPEGVTSIGEEAFYGCGSLTGITLPDSLQRIERYAFASCQMTEIAIPNGVTEIGSHAFAWTYLEKVTVPGTVASLSDAAFYNANRLATVRIEEGVSSIGENAFASCYRLTQLILPASLTSVADTILLDSECAYVTAPDGSFAYQWAETNSLLPASGIYESEHPYAPNTNQSWTHTTEGDDIYAHLITFSRSTVFGSNDGLIIADADGSSRTYWDTDLSGKTVAVMGNSFTLTLYANENSENYGFTVTEILAVTEEEFQNYGEFTYIMLSDGTLEITGFTGFRSELTIPSEIDGMAVSTIGYGAFRNNRPTLERVVISEGITAINSDAFYNCYNLVSVTMADSVTFIGSSAFSACYNISDLTLSAGLTQIHGSAFNSCNSLTELVIPEGVTSIGEYAFAYCYKLGPVSLPASLTSIPDSLFEGNSNVRVTAPEGSVAYNWASANGCLSTDET